LLVLIKTIRRCSFAPGYTGLFRARTNFDDSKTVIEIVQKVAETMAVIEEFNQSMIVLVFQKCMKMQINGQTDGPSSSLRQN
jgi:tRNA (Thr-GGU) A37 N-methylase